jgi:hypothetical protein
MAAPSALFCSNRFASRLWRLHLFHSGAQAHARCLPGRRRRGPGKEPVITPDAKAWLGSLACDKANEHGYPHELWTTRLLAHHARERGPMAGHECLANLVQGTVCKILGQAEIKPHKVRYYLERRDAEFEQKILCVYREVQVLKKLPPSRAKPSSEWRWSPTTKSRESNRHPVIHTWSYKLAEAA